MSSPRSSPPSFEEDLKEVRNVAWGGAALITFILGVTANGLQAVLLLEVLKPDEPLIYWQVISLTAPLTFAVAIIVFSLLNPLVRSAAERSGQPFLTIMIAIAAGAFGLTAVACEIIGLGTGLDMDEVQKIAESSARQPGRPEAKGGIFIVSMLGLYAKAYHPGFFISSVITGGILGWTVDKMLPHFIKKRI